MFAEYGADAQIDDVARHAGVGVGTVYRHFPTKEALLAELVRQKFRLFADASARGARARRRAVRRARGAVAPQRRDRRRATPAIQYALASAGEHIWTQAQAEQEELIALTDELIDRARRAGTIRADVDAIDIGMLMCGVCSTMGARPGFDWRRHLELVIDVLRAR